MKNKLILLTTLFLLFTINVLTAQDGNRKIGVGIQSSFPIYGIGISAKIRLADKFMVQAIISPFGRLSDGGNPINFYGARGIYRFRDAKKKVAPYAFAGAGMIQANESHGHSGILISSKTVYLPTYGLGAGIEFFPKFMDNFGGSIELGYGSIRLDLLDMSIQTVITGIGLHYYLK